MTLANHFLLFIVKENHKGYKMILSLTKQKKGFSLIEIILVISVGAAMLVAAFIIYPKVQVGERAQKESQNIATIAAGIKGMYASVAYYTDITTANVVHAHVFPDDMLSDAHSVQPFNVWKGLITITSSNEGPSGVVGSSFIISYPNVPEVDCIRLSAQIANNYYILRINGKEVKPANESLQVDTLGNVCKSGGNANTLDIVSY